MSTKLASALRAANIRRVLIVRHGNTNKAEVDADRQLTEKGHRQCELFHQHYADLLTTVTLVLASSAKRTMATASLIMPEASPVGVDDLYFVRPWRTEEMVAADRALCYAPISAFIEQFLGVHAPAGQAQANAVADALRGRDPAGDLLICGHAVQPCGYPNPRDLSLWPHAVLERTRHRAT